MVQKILKTYAWSSLLRAHIYFDACVGIHESIFVYLYIYIYVCVSLHEMNVPKNSAI